MEAFIQDRLYILEKERNYISNIKISQPHLDVPSCLQHRTTTRDSPYPYKRRSSWERPSSIDCVPKGLT